MRALLLISAFCGAASHALASPVGIVRPRLVTAPPAEAAAATTGSSGPSLWLVGLAVLITLATLSWWGWWAFRYRLATMSDADRAFARLSRVIGLSSQDRKLLRVSCERAGVDPLAALGSPSIAAVALAPGAKEPARLARLRTLLCDTSDDSLGTKVA